MKQTVISLEYEAYESMALKEMGKICSELRIRWPTLKHIAIYHRLGSVPVAEESVVIAVSAPHRPAALESVSFAVDKLKSSVPIWKKEIYENDQIGEWKANMECPWPQFTETSSNAFEYSLCKIERQVENISESKLVQIRVSDIELTRRIKCFLKRKRDEINLHNIIDFKQQLRDSPRAESMLPKDSCARTQSILVKQQQSISHIKVHRAFEDRRQTRPDYSSQLNKLMATKHKHCELVKSNVLKNARLQNIEEYMRITPDDEDNIYNRIKNIENRILILESTSPEYKYYIKLGKESNNINKKESKKGLYQSDRLSEFISGIKRQYEL
ncbi:molybdopterin synthase catalytic subunit isoform X2 [Drosophila mojavensis]|uniref:molybdopterin synthase catalytic subunit isoform X2 n=1 Tax=Drosophila mojavensis TaxID=7230 RepID=UPI0013EE7699|nr:molybdopterin synthase catalytic subunit isoform X2 [Drosophila mojavensis]